MFKVVLPLWGLIFLVFIIQHNKKSETNRNISSFSEKLPDFYITDHQHAKLKALQEFESIKKYLEKNTQIDLRLYEGTYTNINKQNIHSCFAILGIDKRENSKIRVMKLVTPLKPNPPKHLKRTIHFIPFLDSDLKNLLSEDSFKKMETTFNFIDFDLIPFNEWDEENYRTFARRNSTSFFINFDEEFRHDMGVHNQAIEIKATLKFRFLNREHQFIAYALLNSLKQPTDIRVAITPDSILNLECNHLSVIK
jgi:hypothetical protein